MKRYLLILLFLLGCGKGVGVEYRASDNLMLLQQAQVDIFHIINMEVAPKERGLIKAIVPLYLQILETKIKYNQNTVYVTLADVEYAYASVPILGGYKDKFSALVVYQRQLN